MTAAAVYRRLREQAVPPPGSADAALIITPDSPQRLARLTELLMSATTDAYRAQIVRQGALMGQVLTGEVTDGAVLARLHHRATWAAQRIAQTYKAQVQARRTAEAVSGSLLAHVGKSGAAATPAAIDRAYKVEQVWTMEMGLAAHQAMLDWALIHPQLGGTAHVEPQSAHGDDICAVAINQGSVRIEDRMTPLPAHPNCPHLWVADPLSPHTVIAGGGGFLNDPAADQYIGDPLTIAAAKPSDLSSMGWWTAGLQLAPIGGSTGGGTVSGREPLAPEPGKTGTRGGVEITPVSRSESAPFASIAEMARGGLHAVAFDLDDTALKYPELLVPLALALDAAGCRVGVITGNDRPAARARWDALGYPAPAFYDIHHLDDPEKLVAWKLDRCALHAAGLLIDDLRHGDLRKSMLRELADRGTATRVLMLLVDRDAPFQDVGAPNDVGRRAL